MTENEINELDACAMRLMDENKYFEALKLIDKKIENNINLKGSYFLAGYCKFLLHDYLGCIHLFNKSIPLDPSLHHSYYYRGRAKMEIHEYSDALNDFNTVENYYYQEYIFYSDRGIINLRLKRYEDAIIDFNTSIKLGENSEKIYYSRALAKGLLLNFKGALIDLDKAIEIAPKWAMSYAIRAKAKCNLGNYSEGFADCKRAFQLNVDDEYVYKEVAMLFYVIKNEIEKAICCIRISLLLEPDDSLLQFELANYYSEWGTMRDVEDEFYTDLGKYGLECKQFYVDQIAFEQRKKIAIGLYSKSFIGLMPIIRTDINNEINSYTMFLFIGDENFLTNPIEEKDFYFSDPRSFPDRTDCPLLHPINQTKLSVQVSYDNVRIRCLCQIDEEGGIKKCRSMWDRYGNGHAGVAYKLSIHKDWLTKNSVYLNKVNYASSALDIKCESPEQVILDGLFKKDIGYLDEHEWRMIKFGEYTKKKGIKIPFCPVGELGVKVEAVYLGLNISASMQKKIIRLAQVDNIKIYNMLLKENGTLDCLEYI